MYILFFLVVLYSMFISHCTQSSIHVVYPPHLFFYSIQKLLFLMPKYHGYRIPMGLLGIFLPSSPSIPANPSNTIQFTEFTYYHVLKYCHKQKENQTNMNPHLDIKNCRMEY